MSYTVEVRESELFATGATNWWTDYARIMTLGGALTVVGHGAAGDVVRVELEDAAEAEWLCSKVRGFPRVPVSAIRQVT